MKITVHRPNQIGGCITEITNGKTRIIIDIGSNLPGNTEGKYVDVTKLTEGCAGVFITHYHGDHMGEYKNVTDGVPIYIGGTARKMLLELHNTLRRIKEGNPELINKLITFQDLDEIPVGEDGDITVKPLLINHSAYDAYMFLITCKSENKRILHTGDFRMHGPGKSALLDKLEKHAKGVNAIIIEGTMLSRDMKTAKDEDEIGRLAKEVLSNPDVNDPAKRNIFVLCSAFNIDTIAELYHATQSLRATKYRKPFVVDGFQKRVLRIVSENPQDDFYKFDRDEIYRYNPNNKKLRAYMDNCGFCMLARANPKSEIFSRTMAIYPQNTLVYSLWEGYIDPNSPGKDDNKLNFVNNAVANGSRFIPLHTSGHATEMAIVDILKIIKPGKILPIHCEKPDRFEQLKKIYDVNSEIVRLEHEETKEV